MSAMGAPLTRAEKIVGVLVYPEAELLDFCGPCEVFASARLDEEMRRESASPIHQLVLAESMEAVCVTSGMRILPDYDLNSCPKLDLLLIPGGHGVRSLLHQSEYMDFLRRMAPQVSRIAAVGNASLLLGEAGLLVGKTATTHFRSVDFFRERYPRTSLLPEVPVVVDGNITTANSVGAGIDMGLLLVSRTYGEEIARQAARVMQVPYPDESSIRSRNPR
jgi:transcriptional regulator GlxA family with amidase domain